MPDDRPPAPPGLVPMRLQRFLARSGVASRRGAEDLMTAGRVTVNGDVVRELGAKVDPAKDVVEVDGRRVVPGGEPVYIALHKPVGYITTMEDPQGRPTVRELVPNDIPGLFPIGRLDRDTDGLLLFTTDGDLAHRLLHPRYHVRKAYQVTVEGVPAEEALDILRRGIELDDGPTKPAEVSRLETGPPSVLQVVISEGRKRQVRRMFSAVGHPVVALRRLSFGPVQLGDLAEGSWRELSAEEITALREHAGEA